MFTNEMKQIKYAVYMLGIIYFQCYRCCNNFENLTTCPCCSPLTDESKHNYCLDIDCGKSHVLVHLNITSGNDIRACLEDDYAACFGLSLGLMTARNLCYWQSRCFVNFPLDKLITSDDLTDPYRCAFLDSTFLRVYSARCARKTEIFDMTAPIKRKKKKRRSRAVVKRVVRLNQKRKRIMIKNHSLFPWYPSTPVFNSTVKEYKMIIKWPRKAKLFAGVRVLGTSNKLTLMSDASSVGPLNESHNKCTWNFVRRRRKKPVNSTDTTEFCNSTQYFKRPQLRIRVRVTKETNDDGFEGFLVCFKVFKNKEKPPDGVHICDVVADQIPAIREKGTFTDKCRMTGRRSDCCCPSVSARICDMEYHKIMKLFEMVCPNEHNGDEIVTEMTGK